MSAAHRILPILTVFLFPIAVMTALVITLPVFAQTATTTPACSAASYGGVSCFSVWRQSYTTHTGASGDYNGDGKNTLADFELWRRAYALTASPFPMQPSASVTPTPSPALGGIGASRTPTPGGSTATPSRTPTPAGPTPTTAQAAGQTAMSFGKWTPSSRDTCTKAQHDAYSVTGPDGKKYPSWHPPTGPSNCTFGHEHGRNPTGYQYWNEIKEHFALDADGNGTISPTELTTAGVPFGYANEQIDLYYQGNTTTGFMRHEDHVGHKIEYANGEGDIGQGTDPFDTNTTGGVVVPIKLASGTRKWDPSGVRCYHFHKIHQGVSTPDALTNNLHEAIIHTKCTSTRSDFPASTSLLTGMIAFGAPGEFIRFCPDNRTQAISLGTTDANRNFPGVRGDGQRNIITRDCVEATVLVPQGQFSGFPYEIWDGQLRIRTPQGRTVASQGGGWEVLDAIRYYNPTSANKISYTTAWCYETLGDRKARGGTCDQMTNFGQIQGITWDDPRSEYRGVHRGQYVNPHRLFNGGGSRMWYADPFGGNAKPYAFPGSIKQRIDAVDADTIGKFPSDPRIILRRHNDGSRSVHGPN